MKTIDIAREIICPIMNEVIKEDFEKAMYTITSDNLCWFWEEIWEEIWYYGIILYIINLIVNYTA